MKVEKKHNSNFLFAILAFAATLFLLISLPMVSYAETGTLGAETPEVICTYEKDGVAVDGNSLTAGTYDVNFVLTGVKNLSVLEVTATYDESQVAVESTPDYLISDDANTSLESMGCVLSGGNIVFGFVSTNEDCSSLTEENVTIATVKMTFNSDCDAESYIQVSENPNFTFAQVDYGDGYADAYAPIESYPDYKGNLYLMSYDVTPAIISGYDINGKIEIATDVTGTDTTVGIVGITVTVEKDGSTVADATTDENGNYTLTAVPEGEYTMLISGPTTVDRVATLIVSADKAENAVIDVGNVGIIICDYNKDKDINATDDFVFGNAYGTVEYNVYCDFNGDGDVNATDDFVFGNFYGQKINYENIIL